MVSSIRCSCNPINKGRSTGSLLGKKPAKNGVLTEEKYRKWGLD
jgi:hypothetical protein